MADYPGATDHNVPPSFMFDSNAHAAIVLHKTGGDATPDAIYRTFLAKCFHDDFAGSPSRSTLVIWFRVVDGIAHSAIIHWKHIAGKVCIMA